MAQLFQGFDPTFLFLVLLPIAALVAAWALRVSCNICEVAAPDYWHAMLAVIIVAVANLVLRFWLRTGGGPISFEAQLLAPLATTVLVLSMSIRTGPVNACKVLLVQGLLCGMILSAAMLMSDSELLKKWSLLRV